MKRNLKLLLVMMMIFSSTISIVSCSLKEDALIEKDKDIEEKNDYLERQYGPRKTMGDTFFQSSTSISSRIINRNIEKTEYIPYADIGIVEDNIEYLLKNKGLAGAYRKEAEKSLQELGQEIITYNDLAKFKREGIASKFALGFMQNAYDSEQLLPAWNATPPNDVNESGKWYQDRLDKWQRDGISIKDDIIITFGPFANSFWHTAYLNNYQPYQLANAFKEISKKYGTKSFDFYFSAPYNRRNSVYAHSTQLLAASLNVLLQQDSEFKIRLSLVAPQDGFNTVARDETEFAKLVGDEIYPLYEFSKFLGFNFVLNLVSGYFNTDENKEDNWISNAITNKVVPNTIDTWKKFLKSYSKSAYDSFTSKQDLDGFLHNRLAITPWIGRRAEVPKYNFTAQDALKVRNYVSEKKLNSISMFYISRDFPSIFQGNLNNTGDLNAIDQNLRSASGYDAFTYSKIFNGKLTNAPIEEKNADKILKLKGALNWKKAIIENKKLDYLNDKNLGEKDKVIDKTGDGISEQNRYKKQKNKYLTWKDANPNRKDSVIIKTSSNNKTYFSPYLDGGLWEGNEVEEVLKDNDLMKNLTLSFVQQVNGHDDNLDLSIAGNANNTADFDWWQDKVLKTKVLQPLKDKKIFQNLKVAYGGFNTAGNGKNPWEVVHKLYKNKTEAISKLKTALIEFNKNLGLLVDAEMPKKLDFDIEGEAQSKTEAIKLLAQTLVALRKDTDGSKWDFSVTLPVLPTGLVSVGKNVYEIFIQEWKSARLSLDTLPVLNIMAMDYGDGIYSNARSEKKTNFDLAKSATSNTKDNIKKLINNIYNVNVTDEKAYSLLAVTPMIGVNDTVEGVFTLEDAKELYNWAQDIKLSYLSIWSFNDDNSMGSTNVPMPKTLTTHGLNYLRKWDFMRALSGKWDEKVKNPARNPFNL